MEIEPINNNLYDQRGGFQKFPRTRIVRKKTGAHKPLDAVTFDSLNPVNPELQQQLDKQFLVAYINALPDEEVNRRMRAYKNSFSDIDNALIEKLIMEVL